MRILTIILMLCMSAGGAMAAEYKSAVFAGGCFWCLEGPFDALPGVIKTESGYTGGSIQNPTYEQVSSGTSGHVEAMRVVYDPGKITYDELLAVFWRNIDPTDDGGQFCDRGPQYRSAVFVADAQEEAVARREKARLEKSMSMRIVTEILPLAEFYVAEEYHQDYYQKNPLRYHYYRSACGRDRRLKQIWGAEAGH
jgi:peptide-methionine (S)-S-oxide reductase